MSSQQETVVLYRWNKKIINVYFVQQADFITGSLCLKESLIDGYYFSRRKSQQAEREYEKVRQQLEGLEESVRDRCKKEFTGNIGLFLVKIDLASSNNVSLKCIRVIPNV